MLNDDIRRIRTFAESGEASMRRAADVHLAALARRAQETAKTADEAVRALSKLGVPRGEALRLRDAVLAKEPVWGDVGLLVAAMLRVRGP